jgi:hypothetical protein
MPKAMPWGMAAHGLTQYGPARDAVYSEKHVFPDETARIFREKCPQARKDRR